MLSTVTSVLTRRVQINRINRIVKEIILVSITDLVSLMNSYTMTNVQEKLTLSLIDKRSRRSQTRKNLNSQTLRDEIPMIEHMFTLLSLIRRNFC